MDRTGWTHAKVNGEMNRLAGIEKISQATLEQLQRRLRYGESWLRRSARIDAYVQFHVAKPRQSAQRPPWADLLGEMGAEADLVFVNGSVLTMDGASSIAEALAVRGSEIVAVGSRDEVEALVGPQTRVVDLEGGTLLPGINDSHIHAIGLGYMLPPMSIDVAFPAVRSIADVVAAVGAAAASKAPGEWIVGSGWDLGYLAECLADPERQPTRQDLDEVSPENPVFLQDFSYHTGWVNTAALRLADISLDNDYTDDDLVSADTEGKPTGVLYEKRQADVAALIPAMTHESRRQSIANAQRELNALGVTSITDPALGTADATGPMGAGGMDAYRSMLADGLLTLRVNALRLPTGMSPDPEQFASGLPQEADQPTSDPRRFNVPGVKIFADGIPPNKTAWMYEEYNGGGTGSLTVIGDTDDDKVAGLRRMIRLAHDAGYQVGVHVTGDRGADTVVAAFEAAMQINPREDARHYVIHADFLSPWALEVCARLGIGANMNPAIKWTISDFHDDLLGPERSAAEWPYRSALDAGRDRVQFVRRSGDVPELAAGSLHHAATQIQGVRQRQRPGAVHRPDGSASDLHGRGCMAGPSGGLEGLVGGRQGC